MKTLILCGGKGTRLRPITENIPKPMVNLKGKPILHHILLYLQKFHLNDFILAIGYKGEIIRDYFKNSDLRIEFSDSGDTGILERINNAKDLLSETSLILYGDTIADVDIKELMGFHKNNSGLLTITTYRLQSPFGIVKSNADGTVTGFQEKPLLDEWVNIGFMVLDKEALDFYESGDDLISFFNKLMNNRKLYEYKHKGKHITVNTEKDKEESEKEIIHFYTYLKEG